MYCTWVWQIGFASVIIGSILNLIALPFCGLVLFSTTVGISIVFNNVIAIWWLGEKMIWKYDIPAFFLVVGGSTVIVLLSEEDDKDYTPTEIKRLVMQLGTSVYIACTVFILIVSLISLKIL